MTLFDCSSPWYWVYAGVAVIVTGYHVYRGVHYYQLTRGRQDMFKDWQPRNRVAILYVQVAWLYFVCSLTGFVSMLAAYGVFNSLEKETSSVGSVALVSFLFLFGVLGISGELPVLIWRGKIPGTR